MKNFVIDENFFICSFFIMYYSFFTLNFLINYFKKNYFIGRSNLKYKISILFIGYKNSKASNIFEWMKYLLSLLTTICLILSLLKINL